MRPEGSERLASGISSWSSSRSSRKDICGLRRAISDDEDDVDVFVDTGLLLIVTSDTLASEGLGSRCFLCRLGASILSRLLRPERVLRAVLVSSVVAVRLKVESEDSKYSLSKSCSSYTSAISSKDRDRICRVFPIGGGKDATGFMALMGPPDGFALDEGRLLLEAGAAPLSRGSRCRGCCWICLRGCIC